MRFGCTIVYVRDVDTSLRFSEAAFGLERRFLHESGAYYSPGERMGADLHALVAADQPPAERG